MRPSCFLLVSLALIGLAAPAGAQDTARQEAAKRAAALATLPADAAKRVFGQQKAPADLRARAIGFYSRGCLAGGVALPVDGETWQVMRVSRNRNWGHPALIALLERFSKRAAAVTGWPGLLVGDLAQPKGGPMLTGHASHQIGLDADVWFTPMPDRRLTMSERDEIPAANLVRPDWLDVDPAAFTAQHVALLKAAAREPQVARIFVNPAIKKALCREVKSDRGWMSKVRPIYGHNYHFHIRMACPAGEAGCKDQAPPGGGDGCGTELAWWFTDEAMRPKKYKAAPPMTMAALPAECRTVAVGN